MAQLYILPAHESPNDSQRTGGDVSVCGDCPARPLVNKQAGVAKCYVDTWQGPLKTWKTKRGLPVELEECVVHMRAHQTRLRLGAFGDPAALPRRVVETLARAAERVTGYTHAWRNPKHRWLRRFTMASVENEDDATLAQARGWRTYRVRPRHDELVLTGEIDCPAVTVGITCFQCCLCDGTHSGKPDNRKNITIEAH